MTTVYIEVHTKNENEIYTTVESFVILYLISYLDKPKNITILTKEAILTECPLRLKYENYQILISKANIHNETHRKVNDFKVPVFIKENLYIAGLAAVCREIIVQSNYQQSNCHLLGFKESCLLATTESSVWTKFCELDVVKCIYYILNYDFDRLKDEENFELPEVFPKFESHMGQPARVHNIYKIARKYKKQNEFNNMIEDDSSSIECGTILEHKFAEGYEITLADIMLYAYYSIFFNVMPQTEHLLQMFPLTTKWYSNMTNAEKIFSEIFCKLLDIESIRKIFLNKFNYISNEVQKYSLYKSDPKRYKPKNRIFTRQEDINHSLEKIERIRSNITSDNRNFIQDHPSFWEDLPKDAMPECGELPEKRLYRKKHQLENLAKAVIQLAKDGDRIVDFCSGSGHLGIILASRLPNCSIIFLENKPRSLSRAKERIEAMNLPNASFYQCNLDYFIGHFDIGTSLHACGTATDIVLLKCIQNKARFVCCPCCYGGISPMPHISYPLSKEFKAIISQKEHLFIAHAADQAHSKNISLCNIEKSEQGEYCMDIIDTDRKRWAEESGYKVLLTRLQPEDCTPKNRLLIGTI